MLFTCKFTSDKQAIPKINIDASCDPNLAEDFQEGPHRNRTSQRFMTRKKNCLTSYAKIRIKYHIQMMSMSAGGSIASVVSRKTTPMKK